MLGAGAFQPQTLDRDAPFYVAGHRGRVGSAIWRKLRGEGFNNLLGKSAAELDLKDRDEDRNRRERR